MVIAGEPYTARVAVAVPPLPLSAAVIVPVVFTPAPAAVVATLTENVQAPAAASLAPDSEIVPLPAAALIVPPGQDPLTWLGVVTIMPAGSLSEKAIPLREAVGLVFVTVKETVTEVPA